MAYITLAEAREYMGIKPSATEDDALITSMINSACKYINRYTNRVFESQGDTTRFFNSVTDTRGRFLFLDHDIHSITTIDNDGSILAIPTDAIPYPRNAQDGSCPKPYERIKILCTQAWCYSDCADDAIEVTGDWAYSATPPDDIIEATKILVNFYYKKKDASVFENIGIIDAGALVVPQGTPTTVIDILDNYVVGVGSGIV